MNLKKLVQIFKQLILDQHLNLNQDLFHKVLIFLLMMNLKFIVSKLLIKQEGFYQWEIQTKNLNKLLKDSKHLETIKQRDFYWVVLKNGKILVMKYILNFILILKPLFKKLKKMKLMVRFQILGEFLNCKRGMCKMLFIWN